LSAIVVDASVAVKWFVPEPLTDEAVALLEGPLEMLAPDLIYPEAANILWKKVGRGEIEPRDARDVLAALVRVPLSVVPSSTLVEAALEIALVHRRTAYDGLYVALAVAREAVFVTADGRLVEALRGGPLASRVEALGGRPAGRGSGSG
jgi:predicted nucleic acid-binding protein